MNGLGISFLPYYSVRNEVEEGSLKMLDVDASFDKFATQLAYHKNKRLSVAMSKLIEIALANSAAWE
jgi:DNA-binding transcriptional LysR family regulator